MEIRFFITEDAVNNMDVADYEALERAQDGDVKLYRLRPMMCRFMVDENNQPISFAQALKITDKIKMKEMKDFVGKFFETMKGAVIPKETGSLSQSPIEVKQVDYLSQAG